MKRVALACLVASMLAAAPALARKSAKEADKPASSPMTAETFAGLAFREIGPALMSGRIADIEVDPTDAKRWFLAVASGGVWRTENAGTTWVPVFDAQG